MRTLPLFLAVVPALALAQSPSAAELSAKLDDLDTRHDAASEKEEPEAVAAALEAYPDEFDILWRAARYQTSLAGSTLDDKAKERWAKEAWELGDKARALKPDDVRGHYYAAIGVGTYSEAVGILQALMQGIEGKYNERLDRAIALNPDYDQGGPVMLKGRYHQVLPWPKQDLKKAIELLKKVTEKFPGKLRARLYLAQALLENGDAKGADRELKMVAEGVEKESDPAEQEFLRAQMAKTRPELDKKLK